MATRRPPRVGAPSFPPGLGGLTFRPAKAVIPAEVCFQAVNPNPRPMRDQQAPPPQPGSVALGCRASTPIPPAELTQTNCQSVVTGNVRAIGTELAVPSWLGVFGEDMDGEVGVIVVPALSLFVPPTPAPTAPAARNAAKPSARISIMISPPDQLWPKRHRLSDRSGTSQEDEPAT